MSNRRSRLLAFVVGLSALLMLTAWQLLSVSDDAAPIPTSDDDASERKAEVPPDVDGPCIRISIEVDKKKYLIGESIVIRYVTENVGNEVYEFVKGGDYRGATRHLSYGVDAIHEDGSIMPDPDPEQMCFGGVESVVKLGRGEKDSEPLDLYAYRRLEKPGKYLLSAGEGSVAATIELIVPTPEQASKLVDDLDSRSKAHGTEPLEIWDYQYLLHPVYLPLMAERAKKGSFSALLALGQTPDPEATRIIIALLEHPDPKFVYKAQEALYLRLPDPILDKKINQRNFFDREFVNSRMYLRDKSWKPEFAPIVRKHALKCLARRDEASMFRGAFMLSCLGTAEDLPEYVAAFDFAVKEGQNTPVVQGRYPRAPGACNEFRRAAKMLVDRGVPVDARAKTSGGKILFAEKVHRDKSFRPEGWEQTFDEMLKDEMNYVRRAAIECCPSPIPELIRKRLPELIRDRDTDVQIAALRAVASDPRPEWKPAVLEVFRQADELWLRNAVDNAAWKLCEPLEITELFVNLIEDPTRSASAVGSLTWILKDTSSRSGSPDLDTAEKRKNCKAAWVQFVAANRDRIVKPAAFSVNDPIPLKELFPGIAFGQQPPELP